MYKSKPSFSTSSQSQWSQMQEVVSALCLITLDLENGISDCEVVCEHIGNTVHPYNDLCKQVNPKEGKIVESLTNLISVENKMINLIEEIIAVAETQLQVSASLAQQSTSFKTRKSNHENGEVPPPLWDANNKYQGIELHKFLQINDHIDRVCQCSQYLVRIKRAILANKNEDEDFSFSDSPEDECFAEQFMERHCRRKRSPEASVDKICNDYDATLPNFEKAIMTLNTLLVQP